MHGAPDLGPRFDLSVPAGGYAWWYLDAASDDGQYGLTLIAFVGSVFSPFYAAARRRGVAAAIDHCAINVAFYGRTRRWAMTERSRGAVDRTAESFRVGPSRMQWQDGSLVIEIDEQTVPMPSRLRGTIRVTPVAFSRYGVTLDARGRHRWRPIAPHARVELDFSAPALRWTGAGYLDSNNGDEPLEAGFTSWHWSRSRQPDGTTRVFYDTQRRDGSSQELALAFDPAGEVSSCPAPPMVALPSTLWRIDRRIRAPADVAGRVRVVEDTPFYARSMALGADESTPELVHESLSLDRFSTRWVQTLLPFRMRRERARRA
jgi:carotenoid 1,2-hydratase